MDLQSKTDSQIQSWIRNHEAQAATSSKLYLELLEERVRRSAEKQLLDFDRSLEHLKHSAVRQTCTSYGDLAAASNVPWVQARHQMNGPNGHLDRLLDICHVHGLPLLTAICVNQGNLADGELGEDALAGFVAGARRLGIPANDARAFHREAREACFAWGLQQAIQPGNNLI